MMNEHLVCEPTLNLTALKTYFTSLKGVIVVYLFGSHGRGQARPLSDMDIAVLFDDEINETDYFNHRLNLIVDLSDILQFNDVDVLILNQTHLALSYRVLRDGVVLYCSNKDKMVIYKAKTVVRYLDFEPYIKRHEQAILERARKGKLLDGYNPHRGAIERYRQRRKRLNRNAKPNG